MDAIYDPTDKRLICRYRNEALGRLLKSLREERGLRQADVAQLAGFGQSDVSKVESGERGIRFVELDFYAKALGVDVGTLAKIMFETMWEQGEPRTFDAESILLGD